MICRVCRAEPSVVLPAGQLRRIMRREHVTIAALAARMGVSQDRVREARQVGVRCYACACDWWEAVTGVTVWHPRLARWLAEDLWNVLTA